MITWLTIFPSFRQVLDAVSDRTTYAVLMYLYFVLTAASCSYWTVRIGAKGRGLFWLQPLPWVAVGLGVTVFFAYLALFNDLTRQAGAGGTGLFYMTSSPLLFALVYCVFFPLVTGGCLGLAVKSAIAFFRMPGPDDNG